MAKQEEIIIEVKVNAGESAQKLADVQAKIHAVKMANKELKAEQKQINEALRVNGSITSDQSKRLEELSEEIANNTADLKKLNAEEKMHTAQLNTATQNNRKYGDSLVEMSAKLAQLKQEYRGLTAAQRDSEGGKRMLENIQQMDKALKDADSTMGDFQRNVGNYQSALLGLNGNVAEIAVLFQGGFKQSVSAAGQAVKNFGKMLLTTPVGWIAAAIAAVVGALGKLRDAFRSNDEAGTALSAALSRLSPIIDGVNKAFSLLAETAAKVVNAVTSVATTVISKLVPGYDAAAAASERLVRAQDALEDKEREYVVNHALNQAEIADLQDKAAQRDKYTNEQRLKYYDDALKIEERDLKEKRRIAEERYNIALAEAAKSRNVARLTTDEYNKLSDDVKKNLADLKAAYIDTDTEMSNFSRSVQRRRQAIKSEMENEAREAAEAARRAAEEARKRRAENIKIAEEEIRKLEDLSNAAIEDMYERRRKQAETSYTRQIDDLKKRLETEKNLTKDAREAISGQIVEIENAMWRELATIDEEQMKESSERLSKMSEEAAKRAEEAAKAAAAAIAEEQNAIRKEYERSALEIANTYQEQLNEVYGNAAKTAELELERAETYYNSIVILNAETKAALYESEEAYKQAVLSAEAEMISARERSASALQQQANEISSTMQAVTGALSDLFEAAASDSETYEKFKKAMAIIDATISLASTIAAATAASTAGDPYTLAIRIAANVAAVTAQFAAVIASLKQASVPSAPRFERGGIVPGNSYSGDRVEARVNSGEMIITREQQTRLYNYIQDGVPTYRIDYAALADALSSAVSRMPPPILDYREFTAFARRVELSELKRKTL